MDVLYSLTGVEELDLLAQDEIFTHSLNFAALMIMIMSLCKIDFVMIYYLVFNTMLNVFVQQQQCCIVFYVLLFIQI